MALSPADLTQIINLISSQLAANRIKISALPAAGNIGLDAVFPIVDSGSTQKLPLAQLLARGFTVVPVGQSLRAMDPDTLVDGSMFYITGVDTPNDGGEGLFIYDAASIATDNIGTVIAPDAGVGRFLRQYEGLINVRWFEAKGDGTTDDADAINAAFAFALETENGVWFPAGTYAIESGLVFTEGYKNVIAGTGDSTIIWTGVAGTGIILTLTDCYEVVVRDLRLVSSANAIASGVWFRNDGALSANTPTTCRLQNVEIDGVSNKIGKCVRIGGTGSLDGNNDFHFLDNCTLTNFSFAGLSLENSQVYDILLSNCRIFGNGVGEYGIINNQNGGFGGNFHWRDGALSGHTISDIHLGNPTSSVFLMDGVNSEGSNRLLTTDGPSGAYATIAFCNGRWASNAVNADGKVVLALLAGVIVFDAFHVGDDSGTQALVIQQTANFPDQQGIVFNNSLIDSNAATLFPSSVVAMVVNSTQNNAGTYEHISGAASIPTFNTALFTFNFGSVASGAVASTNCNVPGAVPGDNAVVNFTDGITVGAPIILTAIVRDDSSGQVEVEVWNPTAGPINVGSRQFRVRTISAG